MQFSVNDRDRFKKPSNSDNVTGLSEYEVEEIAAKLCERFNDHVEKFKPFYCKLARKLPQAEIWGLVETAERNAKRSVGGYFMTLGMRAMGYPPRKRGENEA